MPEEMRLKSGSSVCGFEYWSVMYGCECDGSIGNAMIACVCVCVCGQTVDDDVKPVIKVDCQHEEQSSTVYIFKCRHDWI